MDLLVDLAGLFDRIPGREAVAACVVFAAVLVGFGVVSPGQVFRRRRPGRSRQRRRGRPGVTVRLFGELWEHRPFQTRPVRLQWLYVHHASPTALAAHCVTLPEGRTVLYVGVSNSVVDRSDQHGATAAGKSPWIHLTGSIELIPLPPGTTRAQAEAAERRLIAERRPLCNQAHNPYLHWPTLQVCRRVDRAVRYGDHGPVRPLAGTRDRLAVAVVRARRSASLVAVGAACALAAPHVLPVLVGR